MSLLTHWFFYVVAHHAQGQKLQPGTSKLKQREKPNLKLFASQYWTYFVFPVLLGLRLKMHPKPRQYLTNW